MQQPCYLCQLENVCVQMPLPAQHSSALYSSVNEDDVFKRQLMINVSISPKDQYFIEIVLRCLGIKGDGIGRHENNDGGVLATVMAAGFKGELNRFQAGVTMEIS